MKPQKMEIVYKKIDELKPYANNPRQNEAAVQYVANSIKEFGFKNPIIIDKNGEIIAGHTRYKAGIKLGLTEVPCIVADDLTKKQIKAFRLADNKTAEMAEWDFELLENELFEIEDDFDMGDFGFELGQYDISVNDYGTEFSLPTGDKEPVQNMTFTFSNDEAEIVKEAISDMKKSVIFKQYNNPLNENSNGRALYLVVREWQVQKI